MRDVVVVIGTSQNRTGVGKSQLAIDLALALNDKGKKKAEVINADSMQVYRGLDTITNKATKQEMQGIQHHLMDFLDPGQDYRVDRFRHDAMEKIEELDQADTLPIVVGGTMYFIQHLLFPGNLVSAEDAQSGPIANPKTLKELPLWLREAVSSLPSPLLDVLFVIQDLPNISSPDGFAADFPINRLPSDYREGEKLSMGLHTILQAIDPTMAARWHWRDIRKVRRSVEVALQTGKPHSQIIAEQKDVPSEAEYRTLVFWVYARPEVLEPRLDGRVTKMLERGLLDEIRELRKIAQSNQHIDMSRGVYQAIGYKEFSAYFEECASGRADQPRQDQLFREALESMQIATRQYARRQIKWIRNRFLPAARALTATAAQRDNMHVYCLDATDLSGWKEDIQDTAIRIAEDFLARRSMVDPTSLSRVAQDMLTPDPASKSGSIAPRKAICEICTSDPAQPVMIDEGHQEMLHKQSRGHRKRLQKLNRQVGRRVEPCAIAVVDEKVGQQSDARHSDNDVD